MKTITLVGWKRPRLLEQVIESLRKNNTAGYCLIGLVDAGYDPECYSLLYDIGFMPKHIVRLDQHHGVEYASKRAIDEALKFGTELNFSIEEDTVLSPDCLDLVNWWSRHHDGIMCAFNYSRSMDKPEAVLDPYKVGTTEFNAWGWATRAKTLKHLFKYWLEDSPGWDISVRIRCQKAGFRVYQPVLSRVLNIGAEGSHYTPQLFEEHFGGVVASDGTRRNFYLE